MWHTLQIPIVVLFPGYGLEPTLGGAVSSDYEIAQSVRELILVGRFREAGSSAESRRVAFLSQSKPHRVPEPSGIK